MAELALLILTLCWGTTFLLVKNALEGTSPGVFLLLRFGLAAAVLAVVVVVRRDPPTRGVLRQGLLLGLAMFAGFALQTMGLRLTTPARSGFLTGLSVLFVPFLARFLLRRRVPASAWVGVALALSGLLALTRPFGDSVAGDVRLGDALTVGCAVAFALQITFVAEWSARHPLALFTLVQVAVTFALSGALLEVEVPALRPSAALWGTVAYCGVVMTAGAFFVMNWGARHTTAVRAAFIFSLEPVAAALFSHWVGGEPLQPLDWVGGALIVGGVLLGEVGGVLEARARPVAVP